MKKLLMLIWAILSLGAFSCYADDDAGWRGFEDQEIERIADQGAAEQDDGSDDDADDDDDSDDDDSDSDEPSAAS